MLWPLVCRKYINIDSTARPGPRAPADPWAVIVSILDAQPTEEEREVWEQVDVVLKDAKGILDELQAYKGAGQEIREVKKTSL